MVQQDDVVPLNPQTRLNSKENVMGIYIYLFHMFMFVIIYIRSVGKYDEPVNLLPLFFSSFE